MPRFKKETTPEQRFLMYVKKTPACWLWIGSGDRYGRFKRGSKVLSAHRYSYELYKGKIRGGLYVCHTCDNPKCVNPEHLFLGTAKDNAVDMIQKGRSMFGQKNNKAKLSESDVRDICREYADGVATATAIAQKYNVCKSTIARLLRGDMWKQSGIVRRYLPQPLRKLNKEAVFDILKSVSTKAASQAEMARKYKVSPAIVCRIIKNQGCDKWQVQR